MLISVSTLDAEERKPRPPFAVAAVIFGGLGLLGVMFAAVAAIYFGGRAHAAYIEQPHAYSSDLGRVGSVLGWVGVVLFLIGLALYLLR